MEVRTSRGRTVKIRTGPDLLTQDSSSDGLNHFSQNGDSLPSIRDSLLSICTKEPLSTAPGKSPHLASILNIISKQLEKTGPHELDVDLATLFFCLRIILVNESKSVRAAGLRVIRLCLVDQDAVQVLLDTHLHHFIAKCYDVLVDNAAERTQALRLCRRLVLLNPQLFPLSLGRAVVALASDGGKEKDRMVRASLALLAELCILNPNAFIDSGGIRCFSSAILDCSSPRMQEAMVACFLYLLDAQERRTASALSLRFLVAPYSDYHYKHYIDTAGQGGVDVGQHPNPNAQVIDAPGTDRELRLLCAKQALLTVLRSWSGLLHLVSTRILHDLVRVLLPCHLETRKSMLEFFYTLLRLPLPEWTDEFEVALEATDPSRVHESWRLSDGFVAAEGKALLPHVSKSRPNLVSNHTALLVYCLLEAQLLPTLVEVIVSSDTFISVRATILLGELLHLTSTLLPPACHGTKACLPRLVDYATTAIGPSAGLHHQDQSLRRHRAAQASSALTKIHHMKKRGIQLRSLALRQVVEIEHRTGHRKSGSDKLLREKKTEEPSALVVSSSDSVGMCSTNGEVDLEMRSSRDPDGVLYTLARDCGVLAGGQRDPLLWNWPVLSDLLDWCLLNSLTMEESSCVRSIVRRLIQFYKPSSNQFCQCESGSPLSSSTTPTHSGKGCSRTRLYTTVGCHLMDFLTVVNESESEKILAEFLDDLSSTVRDITLVSSAHDCMLSPGRLSTTACADYFLLMGRLSASTNGINALERAGIFQDLLELVASTHHDCYLKLIVSTLNYHTDGYARAILKKVLVGTVESGRIYATHQLRILVRAAAEAGTMTSLAKWVVPLLLGQLKDKCRAVVVAAADILDEATDDSAFIEALIPLFSQLAALIRQQESLHLDSRGALLLVKLLSLPAGFKLWSEQEEDHPEGKGKISLVQLELDKWINRLNIRYVQLLESDLADGLTQHQRTDDGRYGRLSNIRHAIRDLPIPPHLFSQLNRHREGLDFLRTSGQLSTLFSVITNSATFVETNESILELKAAIWASAHLGTSEAGVALLESAQVVEALVRLASNSRVLALRGTAFFALNLIAVTPAGVNFLSRLGWASIKRHHGELWHVVDDSEWNCLLTDHSETLRFPTLADGSLCVDGLSVRERAQSSLHTDLGATGSNHQQARFRTVSQSSGHSVTFASDDAHTDRDGEGDETVPAVTLTSTPRRTTSKSGDGQGHASCWETDSQPYSLEGSSIHFDSDSDHSSIVNNTDSADQRTCRRAYTLPPPSSQTAVGRGEVAVHARSFSDSHYSPANGEDDVVTNPLCTLNSASGGGKRSASGKTRIWTKLRTSLRFRRSKRFSLPPRSSNIVTPSTPPPGASPTLSRPVETGPAIVLADFSSLSSSACVTGESLNSGTEESLDKDEEDDDEEDSSPPLLIQVNRIGSIHNHLNRIKSVQYKKRRSVSGSSGSSRSHRSSGFNCYIGLCLPVQLSHLHPPPNWFDPPPPPSQPAESSSDSTLSYPIPESLPLGEDSQSHQKEECIICSSSTSVTGNDDTISSTSTPSEEEKLLVRKELLRLVGNMGSSVGLNANEQGLLRLKQRFPWAFHSVCLFSDVCSALTAYGYRLRARRFLHELFMDSPFNELYTVALARLTMSPIGINRIQEEEENNVQPSTSSNP